MHAYPLVKLAELVDANIQGDANQTITGLASLTEASGGQLTFLARPTFRKYLPETQASAVLVTAEDADLCAGTALIVQHPEAAFARIAALFERKPSFASGIHPSAVVGQGCEIAPSASIGPMCVIGEGVTIGAHTVIQAGCIIGDDVSIGEGCRFFPRVTLYDGVRIGQRVTLHSGVVIGSEGFGLVQSQDHTWLRRPHLGSVEIQDEVSIGANTCIDRGALSDTVIETGAQLDNLIQVGHNVRIGAHTAVAGSVGIAGSAEIGRHCLIGGGACINGHITIADGVIITGMAMVVKSIPSAGVYSSGTSVMPNPVWRKSVSHFQRLDALAKRVKQLERLQNE